MAMFFSHSKRIKNESYLIQLDTKDVQNIKLVCLYSKSVTRENSKCCHFASVQVKQMVSMACFPLRVYPILTQNEDMMTNVFTFCLDWEKMAFFELCTSSVLTQNEDIRNFDGSLTLNKGKLIWYSGSLCYAIVTNMTHFFFILFGMRQKMVCLDSVFHLYWRKMKTFGIFTAHWLWIKGN